MEKTLGSLEVGKQFDAIFIDPDVHNGPFDIFLNADNAMDIIIKFLNLGKYLDINIVPVSQI